MRFLRQSIILMLSLFTGLPAARAAIIYSTFDPALGIPNTATGIAVFDGNAGQETLGFAVHFFVSGGTFDLDRITVALAPIFGNSATFAVLADANSAPGQILESFPIAGINNGTAFYSADSVTHPLLADGGSYWMAGFVPSGAADVGWYSYPPPVAMTAVANGPYLDGHWNVFTSAQRIFTLEGTLVAPSVPEPRLSFALVLLLGIMLAIQARRTTRGAA